MNPNLYELSIAIVWYIFKCPEITSYCNKGFCLNVKSETATTETGRIREVYSILPEGVAYYQSFLVSYVKQIESVNHLLNIV